jgi:hypothetical protein
LFHLNYQIKNNYNKNQWKNIIIFNKIIKIKINKMKIKINKKIYKIDKIDKIDNKVCNKVK